MSFVELVLHRFKKSNLSPQEQREKNAIGELFNYCIGLVNREDLIHEHVLHYQKLYQHSHVGKVMNFISLYVAIEQFILGNKAPIVKEEYTRQQFRDSVREHIKIDDLPPLFKVLFVPSRFQRISIYEIGIKQVMAVVESNFGKNLLRDMFKKLTQETILNKALQQDGSISFSYLYSNASQLDEQQISYAFARVYKGYYEKLKSSLGVKNANQIYLAFYETIKKNYDYDVILQVIEVLPEEITKDDRLQFLNKEQLQRQIIEATRRLQAERDQAKTIIDSIGEGLIVVDASYHIITINPAACKMFGVTSEKAYESLYTDLVPLYWKNSTVLTTLRPLASTLQQGVSHISDIKDKYETKRADGTMFPVVFSTTPLRRGEQIVGAVIVFRDVTDTVRDEMALEEAKRTVELKVEQRTRQLRESQNRLFTFLDKLPLSVAIFDQNQRLYFANNTSKLLLKSLMSSIKIEPGTQITELLKGLVFHDAKKNQKIDTQHNPIFTTYMGSSFHSRDIELKMNDNRIPLELFATPIFNELGRVEFVIVVAIDLTEAKIVERSKDEFFSIASHELRTPLTAIRGNTSLIQEYFTHKVEDPELREMIQDIHESSIQLIGIVNDFLNVSRLEQGRMKFVIEPVHIKSVVDEVMLEYQKIAHEKGLYLICDADKTQFSYDELVRADRSKTKETLVNLIGNAIKYTETGGITVRCKNIENFIRITVTDTGRGITDEGKKLLFRKFQQTSDNLYIRDTTKSTGLGLYISKLIVEGMGGRIRLDWSEKDKGSQFSFDLPLVK